MGKVRKSNQDSIYLESNIPLYIVADGMGGHLGGDIASAMCVELIPAQIHEKLQDENPEKVLQESVAFTNRKIFEKSCSDEKLKGMGTTVVINYFHKTNLYVGNVGDSRAYLVNKNRLYQLSKDHSLIQEKINMGIYTREQAQKDKMKNVLVRSVGFEESIEVDVFSYKICKNDLFFICSDGLHGKVADSDIIQIINKNIANPADATIEDLEKTVRELIELAKENGGQDNISLIMSIAK
ncbi:MAG: Stp1/IreP family PP2C-type Ser/Thr phosphatase [Bacteriovoracaceae bacterium]